MKKPNLSLLKEKYKKFKENKDFKKRSLIILTFSVFISFLFVSLIIQASTTIGSNIYNVAAIDAAGNTYTLLQSASASAATLALSSNPIDNLQPGHWYEVPNSHLRNVAFDWQAVGITPTQSGVGVAGVISCWNSGAYDTKRDRLIIWGGGHQCYAGNEIYTFDVNTLQWVRLTDPTLNFDLDASAYYPDGKPAAQHTYEGSEYLASVDKFVVFPGAGYYPGVGGGTQVNAFDFVTMQWERKADAIGYRYSQSAYDPVTGHAWIKGNEISCYIAEYDPLQDKWTQRSGHQGCYAYYTTMDIDPVRRKMVAVGGGNQWMWDISQSGNLQRVALQTTGPTDIINAQSPGFVYDPVSDKFVAWKGGADVYTLDMDTLVWTQVSPASTNTVIPTAANVNGTYGRFRYIPSKNAFIVVNSIDQNVYIYKLSQGGGTPPPQDTTPPTTPTNLTASAVSSSQINLSWTASTDNVGVTGYKIYRSGTQITTSNTTSYSDIGLSPSTSYIYTVSALDAAGNESGQSTSVSATTASIIPGTTNLVVDPGFENGGQGWQKTTSGGRSIVTTQFHSGSYSLQMAVSSQYVREVYQDVAISSNTTYDVAGWIQTNGVGGTGSKIELLWLNAAGLPDVPPAGSILRTDLVGTLTGTQNWTRLFGSYVAPANAVVVRLRLFTAVDPDNSGTAWFDDTEIIPLQSTDTQPPATLTNLTATPISLSQINLSWTASTDNVGVTGYRIYRDGTPIATTPTPSYSDTGLAAATTYTYGVAAYDAAGNFSSQSTSVSATTLTSSGRIIQVGPTRTYTKPSQAAAVAQNGDIVEIDAGVYAGDAATWYANYLTIRAVGGGRAHLQANGANAQGKGIWVFSGNNTTVENIEFSGATVSSNNGAGIRLDGQGLTVRNSYFHNNENGILGGKGPTSDILIENSEFADNGFGDGLTHNIYIGNARSFTMRYSYSHHAKIGHLIKSRAQTNYILYNRLMDEQTGTSSYNIDIPNGGESYVIGNLIQQGPNTANGAIVAYAAEGASNPIQELYFVNNTLVNDRPAGGIFVRTYGTPTAKLINNIFTGPGTVLSGAGIQTNSLVSNTPLFVDQANYDYHLLAGSPAIDAGVNPGTVNSVDLTPVWQYVHPENKEPRVTAGNAIDIGAYEFNTSSATDTTPPIVSITSPASGSTVFGTTTVSVTASDNVGVVGVQFRLDGMNLGVEDTTTPYAITWDATTVANGTHTLMAVARDAAGNTTTSSAVTVNVNNPVADTTAPTTPTNLTATVISSSQINLSWTASTDDVGVTGYKIYRCSGSACAPTVQIATIPSTGSGQATYSNTGLTASTAYTYAVSAYDAANNESAKSSSVSATTQSPTPQCSDGIDNDNDGKIDYPLDPDCSSLTDTTENDTTPPTISSVISTTLASTTARINWQTNEPATSQVEYGFTTQYGASSTLSATLTTSHSVLLSNLSPDNTTYNYRVRSKDSSNNEAISINYSFITPGLTDIIPPASTTNLTANNITQTSVDLVTWTAAGDDNNQGTAFQFDIRYATGELSENTWNDVSVIRATGEPTPKPAGSLMNYTLVSLTPNTTYKVALKTLDEILNQSLISNIITFTTLKAETAQTTPQTLAPTPTPAAPSSGGGGGGGGSTSSGGGGGSSTISDTTPAPQITELKAQGADKQTRLTWKNPESSDWVRTIVVRKQGAYATSTTDGQVVFEGTEQEFTDINLKNNQNYYYSLFTIDRTPNYSQPANIMVKTIALKVSLEEIKPAQLTVREQEVLTMASEAAEIIKSDIKSFLSRFNFKRDQAKEDLSLKQYVKELIKGLTNLMADRQIALNHFIAYGTKTTLKLGAGERAGVVNSYKSAFNQLPTTAEEWTDALKIANGRWPTERSTESENNAITAFKKIYKRSSDRKNPHDDAAVTVMAYGLRPANRNLNSEKAAIKSFRAIYGYNPKSAIDWDIVRAIAYSGARR